MTPSANSASTPTNSPARSKPSTPAPSKPATSPASTASCDIHLRLSRPGDIFTPFGSPESEEVPPGEIVYADGLEVRTRRWVWRQGDKAKIEDDTSDIFFPIDGFADLNKTDVLNARGELAATLAFLGCQTEIFLIEKDNPVAEWAD